MRALLKVILWVLRIVGVDPKCQNRASKVLQAMSLMGGISFVVLYVLEMALNWQGLKSLAKINMFPSACMFLVKTLSLQLKNSKLLDIFDRIESFPAYETFGVALTKKLDGVFRKANLLVASFLGLVMVVLASFLLVPFISDDPALIINGYDFCDLHTSPCFEVNYAWQNIVVTFSMLPNVIGFDCLFVYLVTEVCIAIEITKYVLNQIEVHTFDYKDIKDFVTLHNNVISYINELSHFYSNTLLIQLWFSLGGIILGLYMMTSEGLPPPTNLLLKYGLLAFTLASQLFMYCFGGAIIMEQSKTIANEAYNINWWSRTNPALRKTLSFVIQRSQKVEKISVGRIFHLNLECFVAVLKNAMSMYTLLLTVEKKASMHTHQMDYKT